MAFTNDLVDLAHELFGTNGQAMRRSATATDTYTGQAVSDSREGTVWVIVSADILNSDAAIELPCTVVVKNNDKVIITVYGHGMVVTGVIGGGDAVSDGFQSEFDEVYEAMGGVNDRIDQFGNKLDQYGNRLEEWSEEQEKFQSFWDNDLEELRHSIVDVDVQFAPGTSGTVAPTVGWRSGMFAPAQGQYVWTRNIYINGLGETVLGEPVCISDGRTLAKAPEEMYYLSTSSTALSGGSWSKTYPAFVSGRYYWTKTVITYLDGTTSESTPVCASDLSKAITGTQYFWYGTGGAYVATTPKPANDGAPTSGSYLNLTSTGMTLYSGKDALAAYTASKVTLLKGASTFETTKVTLANENVIMDNTGVEFLKGDAKLCAFTNSDSSYGITSGIGLRTANGKAITMARKSGSNRTYMSMTDSGLSMYATLGNSQAAQLNLLASGQFVFQGGSAGYGTCTWDAARLAQAFMGGKVLSSTSTMNDVTLSETVTYFDAILITFSSTLEGAYDSVWVPNPNGKSVVLSITGSDANRVIISTKKVYISGNRIYANNTSYPERYATILSSNTVQFGTQASSSRRINIDRVVGFKFAS